MQVFVNTFSSCLSMYVVCQCYPFYGNMYANACVCTGTCMSMHVCMHGYMCVCVKADDYVPMSVSDSYENMPTIFLSVNVLKSDHSSHYFVTVFLMISKCFLFV